MPQCQPVSINVVFMIQFQNTRAKYVTEPVQVGQFSDGSPVKEEVYDEYATTPRGFFKFNLDFQAVGSFTGTFSSLPHRGIYKSELTTPNGEFPGEKPLIALFVLVAFLLSAAFVFRDSILALCLLPIAVGRTLVKRHEVLSSDEAIELVSSWFDPRGRMRDYVSVSMQFLGLVVVLWIAIAIIVSMIGFFSDEMFPAANIWTSTTHDCQLESHTYFGYIRDCLTKPEDAIRQHDESSGSVASAFVFGLFCSPDSVVLHQQACFLVFMLSLVIFNGFPPTAWIGRTVGHATENAASFVCVLLVFIIGCAYLFHIIFGTTLDQFSSFGNALLTMSSATFGYSDLAFEHGIETTFWDESRHLLILLTMYTVVVVFFLLNILITIAMDAFSQAKQDEWRSMRETNGDFVATYFFWIFPNISDAKCS